jgi:signal transduction histidine kinase/ligand-binding sensor domain-containing protein
MFLAVHTFCQQYRILHWGIEDGLSQGINQKIIRDAEGFLWITSYEGVNRFDGKSFRNFYSYPRKRASIHGTETTGLVEDSLHNIWIGSGDGLNRYDPVADSVSVFIPDDKQPTLSYFIPVAATQKEVICFDITGTLTAFNTENLSRRVIAHNIRWFNDYVTATNNWLDSKNNILWMPAEKGVLRIELLTGKTSSYFPSFKINAVAHNRPHNTLLLATDNGLMEWDMVNTQPVITTTLQAQLLGKVTCLSFDSWNTLWIGSEENGLFKIEINNITTHFIKNDPVSANTLSGNKINSIYCDRTGMVWAGIATNGIDQLTPGNRFTHFSDQNKLTNNIVRCFFEDPQHNIWIATQGGGINIYNPYNNNFSALTHTNVPGLPFGFIRHMVSDNTNAWIGTERGMCKINMQSLTTEEIGFSLTDKQQLHDLYIEHIISFTDSSWLIATKTHGLFELSKASHEAKQLPILTDRHVFYIAFVKHLLFVSCWDGEQKLYEIKNGVWKEIKNEVTSQLITYVLYDTSAQKFWIGTLKGLLKADNTFHIEHQYTTEQGLSNNYIYALVQEDSSTLWISTNKGLSKFNTTSNAFNIYTPSDGLQGYEYNAKAGFKASDGSLYFGGINGFDVIKKPGSPTPFEKPRFYIKTFLINNLPFEQGNINYNNSVFLSYNNNNITIQAGSIDFITKEKSKIRYKLEGAETNWKIADRDFVINYSQLSPGKYTFIATAADSNNEWNNKTTVLHIIIAKPWWQTWWLYTILLFTVLGCIFLIIRSFYAARLKKQKLQSERKQLLEKERTRIATDMHDDLGAGLSRIRFLSENIDLKQQLHQPIQEDIDKIKTYSHEMIDKMGEIVWALNEKNDSLEDLVAYVRAYSMEYLSQNNISCKANISEHVPVLFVSGEFRRNIFLAVKEALHNIVKHAKATEVRFQISLSDQIIIVVHDNGIGFDPQQVNKFRNGIHNISSRMKAINGSVVIKHQNGTMVYLTAPVPV